MNTQNQGQQAQQAYDPDAVNQKVFNAPSNPAQQVQRKNLVLNLDNADEENAAPVFQPLPKGNYDAVVEEVEFTYSRKSGSPMLKWTFEIIDANYAGRKQFMYTVLDAKFGVDRLKRTLLNLGFDNLDLANFDVEEFASNGYAINKECILKLSIQSYTNEDGERVKSNSVKDVLPSGSANAFLTE